MRNILRTLFMLMIFTIPVAVSAGAGHAEGLKKVEAKYVCMINNKLFDNVQIPTEVDGKTYYGCCPMCKAKLEENAEARTAKDPVSGNIVDKATAVIGADELGKIYYFENEDNLNSFDTH